MVVHLLVVESQSVPRNATIAIQSCDLPLHLHIWVYTVIITRAVSLVWTMRCSFKENARSMRKIIDPSQWR